MSDINAAEPADVDSDDRGSTERWPWSSHTTRNLRAAALAGLFIGAGQLAVLMPPVSCCTTPGG